LGIGGLVYFIGLDVYGWGFLVLFFGYFSIGNC
jgi:hypothetical protein